MLLHEAFNPNCIIYDMRLPDKSMIDGEFLFYIHFGRTYAEIVWSYSLGKSYSNISVSSNAR